MYDSVCNINSTATSATANVKLSDHTRQIKVRPSDFNEIFTIFYTGFSGLPAYISTPFV